MSLADAWIHDNESWTSSRLVDNPERHWVTQHVMRPIAGKYVLLIKTSISGRSREQQLTNGNGKFCGNLDKAVPPRNGRIPLDHGRLVAENINNNLMAGVLRLSDVQRAQVYFLCLLKAALPITESRLMSRACRGRPGEVTKTRRRVMIATSGSLARWPSLAR